MLCTGRGRGILGNFGEFSFHTINFRGLCKSGGARAPAAPPSSAPMIIYLRKYFLRLKVIGYHFG